MKYKAGDIIEVTYNHPSLGSGTFFCKANEDGTLEPGGFRNNDDDNSVTGNGQIIIQKNYRLATMEFPPIAWDMTDKDDQKKLSDLAESSDLADYTIAHVSGAIWAGSGIPVGDIPGVTNTAQVTLKLAFNGKLKQIA